MKKLLLALAALLISNAASADGDHSQDIGIEDAWARATVATMRTSAAYITISNLSHDDMVLTGAKSTVAGMVSVHQSYEKDGIMRMEHAGDLTIKAGETLVMKPGGYHIMLMQLKEQLKADEIITVTLEFADHAPVEIKTVVKSMMGSMKHKMSH